MIKNTWRLKLRSFSSNSDPERAMKIAVIGCGAMGSIYAAFLSEHHEVSAIDVWEEHVQAINSQGLRVEEATGKVRVSKIAATTLCPKTGDFDLAIIATKAANVAEAAQLARSILKEDGLVLSIQNGLGSTDILERLLGSERVFLGVASNFGACMKSPGHAFYEHLGRILIGGMKADTNSSSLQRIVRAWEESGFLTEAVDDIQQDFLANRPCEIANINGAIAAEAAKVGLAAPVNHTVSCLVRALERASQGRKRRREENGAG
eukprot:Skav214849  [mRNA]  locus=scaffold16:152752:155461:+ [translate_table: standard]